MHSETSAALGSCGIQETWQAENELETGNKEGPPKSGIINLGRG